MTRGVLNPSQVDQEPFGSGRARLCQTRFPSPCFCCLHVFIHHSGQKQPDTSFYNQPGTAGILTHSAQKAHPLQSTYFKCTSRLSELQPGNLAQDERLLS